ncbi:LacI family DNA-binding transcriptional regulator [Mesorhizobium sp. L-8-3]|uniref:LacI family DNA-binding transcriptional regulator n=1 Tax=Mesorhizobium sp. L-8-3 TaxID=2744522 RepID=UPI00192896A1|nr:LacI family DNA-binding transcriptional regulator [Mesorhizobium sp. L-8-3]BCH20550.1 LacI family transcriptional regulator [Mesorhizobium sp. L-8-3]
MSTIRDVARIAKVSITTVSATLNGTAPVSEELRARVWAAVGEAGYHPDPVARNLRKGVSNTIGLIVPDIATPWAAHLAKAMQSALSDRGYNMLFASNEDDPVREFREIELFSAHRVAGLIVAPTSQGADYPSRLAAAIRTPAVLVDRVIPDSRFDAVVDDNHLGAQLVTRHLLTLGHRDIAFLVGRPGISPSDERFDGFCQTMAAAGVSVRDDLVRRSCYRSDHAFTAVQQLMNMARPPTAIACINIAQLLGTMAGLKNIGLSVPNDVSVVSFDGFHPAEGWAPSITSLHQDIAAISTRASELLTTRIAGDAATPQIVRIPPRLQIRESCRAI